MKMYPLIPVLTVYKIISIFKNSKQIPATSPNNMLFKIIHTKLEIQTNIFSLLKKTTKLNLEK